MTPETGHNHITRDIKPRGQCPGCDRYHDRQARGASCRSACTTRDHTSFGECVRAANVGIDRTALAKARQ